MSGHSIEIPSVMLTGVPIATLSRDEAAETVIRLAISDVGRGRDVHLCNAYTLSISDRDPSYKAMLQRAALNLADGKSIVWANRLVNRSTSLPTDRAYGPDLFVDVFDRGQEFGLRHYLLGSTPEVLALLEGELRRRFPSAHIVGVDSPPFRELSYAERAEQSARIVASHAQLVWVGLGTPKQDWECARLSREVPAVFAAVGAAFDFVAGTQRQAPAWVGNAGLEWLFRLVSEPRRLWWRYLFGNSRFLLAVAKERRS